MLTRLVRNPDVWMASLLLPLVVWGCLTISAHALTTPVLPADAYFYLSKAENFAAGRGLATYWNDGVDRKFFPLNSLVLAPFSLLRPVLSAYWILPLLLYYLLTALVLALLVRRVEPSRTVAFMALSFWLANPNVILWHSVPYSEGLSTLLVWSALLLCSRGWRACSLRRFLLAAALGGLGMVARAEAALLAAAVGVSVLLAWRRDGFGSVPWRRLALGLAVFVLPLAIWWISIPPQGDLARLSYLAEFRDRFTWEQLAYNFRVLFSSVLFEINIRPDAPWKVIATIVGWRLYLVSIGLAIAGALGPRGRWVISAVLAYQLIHAFWHYAYGRFNLLMLPLALYVFALAIRWVFASWARLVCTALIVLGGDALGYVGAAPPVLLPLLMIGGGLVLGFLGARNSRARRASASTLAPGSSARHLLLRRRAPRPLPIAYGMAAALTLVMFQLGIGAVVRHKTFLLRDDGRTASRESQVKALVLRLGAGQSVLTPVDFPLAYQIGSLTGERVWFAGGLGDFFPPAFNKRETLRFLDEQNIRLILSPRPLEDWIREYHIPPDEAERLRLDKKVPGAHVLEWNS